MYDFCKGFCLSTHREIFNPVGKIIIQADSKWLNYYLIQNL